MELKSKHLWPIVDFWEAVESIESDNPDSQRWVFKLMVDDLRALEALVTELQAASMSEQATAQAEAAMQPLWTNDRIIQAASDVTENPSPHKWRRTADVVDVIRLVRADYEAERQTTHAKLATVKAERDEALAQLASLNKFIDDTLREMVKGEDE